MQSLHKLVDSVWLVLETIKLHDVWDLAMQFKEEQNSEVLLLSMFAS
jgi:hypothetical protein